MIHPEVEMIGVWDTVGTLGIPGAVFGRHDARRYQFLDTRLSSKVRGAYHALSIDEKRRQYPPTLWTSPLRPDQIVEQVWFSGVHGNVGGGYPTSTLSDITLAWMLERAARHGVLLDPTGLPCLPMQADSSLGLLDKSWNPLWGLWKRRTIGSKSTLANSVGIRLARHHHYNPPLALIRNTRVPASDYASAAVVVPDDLLPPASAPARV